MCLDADGWKRYASAVNEQDDDPMQPMKKCQKTNNKKGAPVKRTIPVMPAVSVDFLNHDEWIKKLGTSWFTALQNILASSPMQSCLSFIRAQRRVKTILPPDANVFNAFVKTPLENVRVVILDQEPYNQLDQATGMAFSIPPTHKMPMSLENIYGETECPATHGNLSHWAEQGVFLLNSILTVEMLRKNSHDDVGWADFTDKVLNIINTQCPHVVFLVWGAKAKQKMKKVKVSPKHCVLTAEHPSPASAKNLNPFKGCNHFALTNAKLKEWGMKEIDWTPAQ